MTRNKAIATAAGIGLLVAGYLALTTPAVLEVTTDNVQAKVINSSRATIIMFSTEECGACQEYAPTFQAAAEANTENIQFAHVNLNKYPDLNPGILKVPFTAIYVPDAGLLGGQFGALTAEQLADTAAAGVMLNELVHSHE